MNATQKHHVIPVSLGGFDIHENIIHLTESEHKTVHETLNVEYRSIRLYRLRTNHIIFPNEYVVREMMKVHGLYFRNAPILKRWLIKKHAESLEAQTHYLARHYQLKDFVIRQVFQSEEERLSYMLNAYHTAFLLVVQHKGQ